MKQQEVFKKIGVIIKELNEQYEYLKTVEGPLNELELELFLANSHFLGDHVSILSKLNWQNSASKKSADKPVESDETASHQMKFFEPLVQSPPRFPKPAGNTEPAAENGTTVPQAEPETADTADSYTFIQEDIHEEEPETIRHELILDEADWEDDEEINVTGGVINPADEIEIPPVPEMKPHERVIETPPVVEVVADEVKTPVVPEVAAEEKEIPVMPEVKVEEKKTEPVAEVPPVQAVKEEVKPEVLTINERMSAKMAESRGIAEQLHADKITDLKKAINLNDKLLYIKDLFNGYSLAYSEAIEILNRFTGFEEAELFLNKNYAVKNNWAGKPETTQKFYAILKRRYA